MYLVRGERLRIQACAGYHQIFDGMPFGVGVIGRTYETGQTTVLQSVLDESGYLQANPAVVAEIAVPLRVNGRVVGVLNVESNEPFPPGTVERIEREAQALADAISELGHDVTESGAQRLVRHAIRLGALIDVVDVRCEAVFAARDSRAPTRVRCCCRAPTAPKAAIPPPRRHGVLVIADRRPLQPETSTVELLEARCRTRARTRRPCTLARTRPCTP